MTCPTLRAGLTACWETNHRDETVRDVSVALRELRLKLVAAMRAEQRVRHHGACDVTFHLWQSQHRRNVVGNARLCVGHLLLKLGVLNQQSPDALGNPLVCGAIAVYVLGLTM